MPLYEYRCSKCEKTFEVIQKFADEPLTEHENCGGPVERLLSAPAFQLKGTGWYVTDYAKSGAKDKDADGSSGKKSTESSAPAAESKSGDSKSSESKPSETKSGESKSSESKAPTAKSSD